MDIQFQNIFHWPERTFLVIKRALTTSLIDPIQIILCKKVSRELCEMLFSELWKHGTQTPHFHRARYIWSWTFIFWIYKLFKACFQIAVLSVVKDQAIWLVGLIRATWWRHFTILKTFLSPRRQDFIVELINQPGLSKYIKLIINNSFWIKL